MNQHDTPAKVASTDGLGPLYPERDHMAQGQHYVRHVDAMTREGLHSKSRIAGELAARDIEIDRLRVEVDRLQADHKRMSAIDEPGRRWTFWIGKSAPHQLTTMAVQPYDSMRDVIDRFYGLRA